MIAHLNERKQLIGKLERPAKMYLSLESAVLLCNSFTNAIIE